jgi:hypothetical protein
MFKKKLFMLIVFLLVICFSNFSLAVDVSLDKNSYDLGESVVIAVNFCEGISVAQIENPGGEIVNLIQGFSEWQSTYNTYSDSLVGTYLVEAKCDDGTSSEVGFCYGLDDCDIVVGDVVLENDSISGNGSNVSNVSNVSNGEVVVNVSNGTLDSNLSDATNLTNVSSSLNLTNVTNRSSCEPNWVCGDWSVCIAGYQSKGCIDRAGCLNETREDRVCVDDSIGFNQEAYGIDSGSDDIFSQDDSGFDDFDSLEQNSDFDVSDSDFESMDVGLTTSKKKDSNLLFFIVGFIVVIVLVAGVVVYFVLFAKKVPANLFSYVREQKGKGVLAQDVLNKIILSGWNENVAKKAIKKVFKK